VYLSCNKFFKHLWEWSKLFEVLPKVSEDSQWLIVECLARYLEKLFQKKFVKIQAVSYFSKESMIGATMKEKNSSICCQRKENRKLF